MSKEISDYGTGERGCFVINKATGELEKIEKTAPIRVNAPAVHRDEYLDGIESWLDGKTYYSKSSYMRSIHEYNLEHGTNFEVVGKELFSRIEKDTVKKANHIISPEEDRKLEDQCHEETTQAWFDIKYDRVEFTEKQKQLFKDEEEAWKKQTPP